MAFEKLAEIIFPNVEHDREYYIAKYPKRNLKEGARVTRYAPSPTGFQHIGGVFAALINERLASQSEGVFYLRIEDTDQKREVQGAIEDTISTMHNFGMDFSEGMTGQETSKGEYGPYRQSQRADIYNAFAKDLLLKGLAYPDFCTPEELNALREEQIANKITPGYYGEYAKYRNITEEEAIERINNGESYILRLKSPGNPENRVEFHDLIKGDISFPENNQDVVLIKGDGLPTYHFAHAIDDYLMRTTDVIRGEEWLSSTPKHVYLYEAFGWEPTTFVHLPNILNKEKKKLSKRHGDVAVEDFKKKGYLPEGLVNYVALVGWSPEDNQEIFSMEELENAFSIDRVSKSGGVFDTEKLNWVNQHYVKDADDSYLTDLAIPFLVEAGFITEEEAETKYEFIKGMVSVLKEKLQYVKEITEHANIFFGDTVELETEECREFLNLEHIPTLIDALEAKVEAAEVVDEAFVKAMFKEIQKEHGIKGKNLFMGSRIILTGQMHGPDLLKTMEVLGKETCLNRIKYVKNNVL